jgi:hypothetical protein
MLENNLCHLARIGTAQLKALVWGTHTAGVLWA